MSKRTRRRYTPEQKAALVRQHVVDKKPVSEICSTAQLQPRSQLHKRREYREAHCSNGRTRRFGKHSSPFVDG